MEERPEDVRRGCIMSMVKRDWMNERRYIPNPPPSSGTRATRLATLLTRSNLLFKLFSDDMPSSRAFCGMVESIVCMNVSSWATSDKSCTSDLMPCFA